MSRDDGRNLLVDFAGHNLNCSSDILLMGSIVHSWNNYQVLLSDVCSFPQICDIHDYNVDEKSCVVFSDPESIFESMFGEYYGETVEISFVGTRLKVISQPSSGISIVITTHDVVDKFSFWDDLFIDYVKGGNVGFGREGLNYAVDLLNDLGSLITRNPERFNNIAKEIENMP